MNSFFLSQFNYFPLVWMCHSRLMNIKINRLYEKCFRIAYGDKTSSFEELLDKYGSANIHKRNLYVRATEIFKVYRNLLPNIIAEFFRTRRNNYNLRHCWLFSIPYVKTVYHGSESLSNLGRRIWDVVPIPLKELDDVNYFKTQIKKWQPENCPCRLCKMYIPHVGFI